ncbi:hypothetical protein J7M23_04470 [Candidatus Sumerlaeota bacterium]|nr:hypothetical protein [Candidatus Sumerlaeota bacterium]
MQKYKCIVKYGHIGSGKYIEKALYVRANNIIEAMAKAKLMRGVKKGNLKKTGGSILAVLPQG